ncbi:MAG TPA: hypothetical protein DCM02_09470 [Flavobacterium sp.]|nr:hypothetical protein [Flavobacterium sp.]
MARSTYISENLTQEQINFLLRLDELELDIFSLVQVRSVYDFQKTDINETLENLVHKKILSRIERGKFCRLNFRNDMTIGCFISDNGSIAYWSALNSHGLTDQFPNNIYIQTTKLKRNTIIFGTSYKFIKVAPHKITGIEESGTGNHKYRITNVDKTIVDCFDLPEHSGGYAELIRAFYNAKLSSERMIEYCTAIDNIAATKRMGFLAELIDKQKMKTFIKFAKQMVNAKYNLFDPAGTEKGEFVNDWRLRLNISKEEILDICNKQY